MSSEVQNFIYINKTWSLATFVIAKRFRNHQTKLCNNVFNGCLPITYSYTNNNSMAASHKPYINLKCDGKVSGATKQLLKRKPKIMANVSKHGVAETSQSKKAVTASTLDVRKSMHNQQRNKTSQSKKAVTASTLDVRKSMHNQQRNKIPGAIIPVDALGFPKSKVTNTDPVALYHYYHRNWNYNHIPGESKDAALRWGTRYYVSKLDNIEKFRNLKIII